MKSRRGIFFDLDGTLVDNEHLKARAFSDAIEQFGGKSQPSVYKEVVGMSGPVIIKHFIEKAGIQIDLEAYVKTYKARYASLIRSDLVIRPGAIRFLGETKKKGLQLALVSGSSSTFVTYILNALDLEPYFDFIIASEDVIHKKPHPECYQLAMEKMSVSNEQSIVFEDTEAGLKAAGRAGIACLCIRHAYNQAHDLSSAVAEYDSYANNFANICQNINAIFNVEIF